MAVFTPVSHEDAARFLSAYDIGRLTNITDIKEGVENSNFLIETDQGRFILTLFEARVPHGELPFFVTLMQHLAANSIPCPTPIKTIKGDTLGRLNGKPALIVSFLQGNGVAPEAITPEHCTQLGILLARMHCAAETFDDSRANNMGLESWEPLIHRIGNRADVIEPNLSLLLAHEEAWLRNHWPAFLTEGIVHADAFPDNVFFNQNSEGSLQLTGVIDFYFACTDARLYELAVAINAWCFDMKHQFVPERARALCHAYQSTAPLDEEEWTTLPTLCRGAALRFLLTRTLDMIEHEDGHFVTPKDPMEYVHKLHFHQQVHSFHHYTGELP